MTNNTYKIFLRNLLYKKRNVIYFFFFRCVFFAMIFPVILLIFRYMTDSYVVGIIISIIYGLVVIPTMLYILWNNRHYDSKGYDASKSNIYSYRADHAIWAYICIVCYSLYILCYYIIFIIIISN